MFLWQDAFCQVSHERASPILHGKQSIALFPVYSQMANITLGLDEVCVLAYTWLIEARSLQPLV